MDLANCGVDGCGPLPWPVRVILGAAVAGLALGYVVVWFLGRRG
ncbi:MAG TPA: hypothetical protein VFU47_03555 [Armatimonadota bacterium]|nr:hypothetical protein [Armatimonadota bacterium]